MSLALAMSAEPLSAGDPEPWVEEAMLLGSQTAAGDSLGLAVDLDGDTLVLGAPMAQVGDNLNQGEAYVFVRDNGEWTEQARTVASDGVELDLFGASVAVVGDTIAVGAIGSDIDDNDNQGAVYIFKRVGTVWTEAQKLTASDGLAQDQFGRSQAIEGDTLLVGAFAADIGGNNSQGAAYVFADRSGSWQEQAKLFAVDGTAADLFGEGVDLDGDTALVGAFSATIDGVLNQGAAYVFVRSGESWSFEQRLTASDGQFIDSFGEAVAIDGERVLVGADGADIDPTSSAEGSQEGAMSEGAAYIFERSGTLWSETQKLFASEPQAGGNFGVEVELRGDLALVGAKLDFMGGLERGVIYEFRLQDSLWAEIQHFGGSGGQSFDRFGSAIALSGDRVVVGAPSQLPGGAAYVLLLPPLFADGFETGDTGAWSMTVP